MAESSLGRRYSRRAFLKAGGGALLGMSAMGIAGCGSASMSSTNPDSLSFLVWASTSEEAGFRSVIQSYEKKNPGVKIHLVVAPFDNYVKFNTLLAADMAPDLARIQYQMLGRYSAADVLVDLSDYLEPGYGEAFTPALWQAVNHIDKPYALPHHTDTMALFYNTDIFGKLGIEVPQKLEESWTWDEFMQVSRRIKKSGEAPFPFAMGWQDVTSAYRWMWFLFQHGGQLLNDDLTGPRIDDAAGVETIAWNKRWFDDDLVPPSTSIKSVQTIESLFAEGTTAMMLNGEWLMPFLQTSMTAGWDVTYMIRDEHMASDMGGNAVAITRNSKNPDLAADFLKHLASEEEMKRFCLGALFLPTRKSLVRQGMDYSTYPERMNRFVEQSTTIPAKMAQEQTIPLAPLITRVLGDELEQAFKIGQSAEETAKNISEGIEKTFQDDVG